MGTRYEGLDEIIPSGFDRILNDNEIVRSLACLDRKDLPPMLAITLARQMYPWFDRLIGILQVESQNYVDKKQSELLQEGVFAIENEDN